MVSGPATGGVLMTWFGVSVLVLPTKFRLPAYSATTVCEPSAIVLMLNVATPPDNVPEPAMLPSMRKFTGPPGVPTPGACAVTAKVNVTFAPGRAGLADEVIAPTIKDCV